MEAIDITIKILFVYKKILSLIWLNQNNFEMKIK